MDKVKRKIGIGPTYVSELELGILEAIWDSGQGNLTGREILEAVFKANEKVYPGTTLYSAIERLVARGLVEADMESRPSTYVNKYTRAELSKKMIKLIKKALKTKKAS